MPRLVHRTPKYTLHKASGQAVVKIDGRLFYLGRFNSLESKAEYDRRIAEWLANGRRVLPLPEQGRGEDEPLTVQEVVAAFWLHAEGYYRRPDGSPSHELTLFKYALRPLQRLYGHTPAADFGPKALAVVRDEMVRTGWCRSYVNRMVGRIKAAFKWAAAQELVPASVHHGLSSVSGLKRGRSNAPESEPVKPVPESQIDPVLNHVSPQVRAMVRLQLLTGMRPGEVCTMRGCDLDTTGTPWAYRPASHKTQHHGHDRTVYLGPRAKAEVEPFLKTDLQAFIFSPADAEAARLAKLHEARKTPLNAGNVPGSNRRRRPSKQPGDRYDVASYRRAITRGCDLAFPRRGNAPAATACAGLRW
jgi:integrase